MKSKAVAALLAIFLGELGIHRFYLGDNATGVAYLFASCVGMLTLGTGIGVFVLFIVFVITIIDLVIILCTNFDEKYNNKQRYMQKPYAPQNYVPQQQYYTPQQPVQQPQQPTTKPVKSKTEQLMELKELLDQKILTQEEFDKEKQKILRY